MRGKGWLRDPHLAGVALHTNARTLLGSDMPPDCSFDLLTKTPSIWDQGQTSSCVGQAWAGLLSTMTGRAFSPAAVYALARLVDRSSFAEPLRDEGSMPMQAARAIDEWGVALAEKWPFLASRINAEPALAELEACEAFHTFKPRRIYSYGLDRSLDVRRALSMGFPVVFGIDVDEAFERHTGGVIQRTLGGLGGHYLMATGYDARNGVVFFGRNSWGTGWGESGEFRFSEELLDQADDLFIAEVA